METLIASCFVAIFGLCWLNEVRICAKLREQHSKRIDEIADIITRERNLGWNEGRQYEINRRNHQHPRNRGQFTERTKQ